MVGDICNTFNAIWKNSPKRGQCPGNFVDRSQPKFRENTERITWETKDWLGNYDNFSFRTFITSGDRGTIWHLKGTGRLQSYELFPVQFSQSGNSTYTARPSSMQSVLEGKIDLPSVPRSVSTLAAHSTDAMSMNNELLATSIPTQMRRPKPWRTLIFWIKNTYMLTICYMSLSVSILRNDIISVLIKESLGPEFFEVRIDTRVPKQWIKGINLW